MQGSPAEQGLEGRQESQLYKVSAISNIRFMCFSIRNCYLFVSKMFGCNVSLGTLFMNIYTYTHKIIICTKF